MIADVLAERRIVICAGSGGVGKTTTAAALAMGMAERGLKVAVVTIDPARRLATSLGLERLGNEPRLVDPERFAGHGVEMTGELWAMMLDPKTTFDDLIVRLAPDARTRDEILRNPIYQQLSSAVSGSQEFTAIAKLYELDQEGGFDVIVLDTPPSRNALDFLDAPGRLQNFFQGRAIRIFLRPAGFGGRLIGAGTGVVFSVLKRATGVDLLQDLSVFFRAMGGILDGFVERADHVGALLADPGTTFLIVTSPEPEPVEEALHFHTKLRDAGMPFGALIVNRVRMAAGEPLSEAAAAELGEDLGSRVALAAADITALAERDRAQIDLLEAELDFPPLIEVPQFADDVHDVDGLALVTDRLFA